MLTIYNYVKTIGNPIDTDIMSLWNQILNASFYTIRTFPKYRWGQLSFG